MGWIEWNLALDLSAGPSWFDRPGCGGPVYIDPARGEAYKQPTYYALAHFSKFVSPDSVRVGHEVTGRNAHNIQVLTAKRPDGALVAVVLNSGDNEWHLNLAQQSSWFAHKIPAHSIHTYIWWL